MFHSHVFPNGFALRGERIKSPLVAIWIGTRTGTLSDPEPYLGLNHIVEHLCHSGTEQRSFDQIADEFEELGDYHNAGASARVTQFHALVLREDVPRTLALFADILRPKISPERLEREKDVVLRELSRANDDPHRFFQRELKSLHCRGHLAARTALGTVETVRAITPEVVTDFNRLWYRPRNMILSCAGGINKSDLIREAGKTFGKWPDEGPSPELPVSFPEIPEESKHVRPHKGLSDALVGVAASLGDLEVHDEMYLSLASTILGRRLKRQLRKAGRTYASSVSYGFHGRHYVMQAQSASSADKAEEMSVLLEDHIERLAVFGERELEAVKKRIQIATDLRGRALLSRAETAGMAWALGEPYELPEEYFERARAVTVDDLARFLKKHPVRVQTRLTLMPAA